MPVISVMSPKGGAGKSTTSFLLATMLAEVTDVTIIDADPSQPIKAWSDGGNTPSTLAVVSDVNEATIARRIQEAARTTPFVVIDNEGIASKTVLHTVSNSDFVIIPMQPSPLDAVQASRAVQVVEESQRKIGMPKGYAALLTRTNSAVRTRSLAYIQKSLIKNGIPVLKTELHERDAFRAVFAFQQTLQGLKAAHAPNIERARINVGELVAELLETFDALGLTAARESNAAVAGAA